jgi:glycosyltransferase involved in cell wall biosynthesis
VELSVIIPAFNRERTIGPTIESVRVCGVAAEIIVVDDGSKDRTVEVARGYGVTVLEQPNGGPSPARNNGFRHSRGEIIAFLDSDDVWHPGVVPDALRMLRDHPDIDVLFGETLFGNDADGYQELSDTTGRGRFSDLLGKCLEPDLFRLDREPFVRAMLTRNQVFLGSALIRRRVLDREGVFDPALFGGEDYELCLRLSAAFRFAFLARPLARYEKHAGGLSANADRMAREFALVMRNMRKRRDLFTPAEMAVVEQAHRDLSFQYAYLAYDRGDAAEARRRFAARLRHGGFSLRSAALWLACRLPGGVVRRLRRAKQGAAP